MDESMAAYRGRKFVQALNSSSMPVNLDAYADEIGAEIKIGEDLAEDEPGYSFSHKGKQYIILNANDIPERQRFTACHEIGHIVLGLSSSHEGLRWSYEKRPESEIFCDVFASELLLPHRFFKPLVDKTEFGFSELDVLAQRFEASVMATGSRFVASCEVPCAFVISEKGTIRYASRSKALREAGAWIQPGMPISSRSLSWNVRNGQAYQGSKRIDADYWFDNWGKGRELLEEARHLIRWDQTMTLLWFEEDEILSDYFISKGYEEDTGLKELDGCLPWPGKSRRRP
ncbi:MAG: ImmA/IrrE family metallo-endopeptidase [Acidimicrobiales bacterium]